MVLYVAADVAAKQIVLFLTYFSRRSKALGHFLCLCSVTTVVSINWLANERGPRLSRFCRFCHAGLSFLWINAIDSCLQFYIHIIGIT